MTADAAADNGGTQSWDAFWSEVQEAGRTETICGVVVKVPTDITLRFDRNVQELMESGSEDDVEQLVADLFGADVYQQWVDAGMTARQFRTVLGWGMANAKGKPLSFRAAYDLMRKAEDNPDGPGNDPAPTGGNRAQRRQSERTGGQSKRTSGGNTGSRRKR